MVDQSDDEAAKPEAISSTIFLLKLEQLDIVRKRGDREKEKEIRTIIKKDIRSLPMESISGREKHDTINRALSTKF
jgi:type I restriction enzyme R subunit